MITRIIMPSTFTSRIQFPKWHLGIFGALLLVLASCVTPPKQAYDGAERPQDEVALLMVQVTGQGGGSTVISEIDGRQMGDATSVYVLPGRHTVRVKYKRLSGSGSMFGLLGALADEISARRDNRLLYFTASARSDYIVKFIEGTAKVDFWIEDRTTREIVSQQAENSK